MCCENCFSHEFTLIRYFCQIYFFPIDCHLNGCDDKYGSEYTFFSLLFSLNDGQGMCYGKDDGGTTSPDYNNMDEPEWDEIDEKTICKKNQACTSGENIPEQALATDGIDTKLMQSDIQLDQNERSVNEPPRLLSLNEIFGSLPDIVHAVDVLTPIQSNSDSLASNSNQHTENEFTGWLIDFSDSTDMPSPFTHVRNTCSIVDLLMT